MGAQYNDIADGMRRRIQVVRAALPYLDKRGRSGAYLEMYFGKLDTAEMEALASAGTLDLVEPSERLIPLEQIEATLAGRTDELAAYTRVELIARGLDPDGLHFDQVFTSLPQLLDFDRAALLQALAEALPAPLRRDQYDRIYGAARSQHQTIPELCLKVAPEWRREAVKDTLSSLRRSTGLGQLLGRMAFELSPHLPASRQKTATRLLGGIEEFWFFNHTAKQRGAFSIPDWVVNYILAVVQSFSEVKCQDASEMAWMVEDIRVRARFAELVARRCGSNSVQSLVLRASLESP
jgi:hypothetical protein